MRALSAILLASEALRGSAGREDDCARAFADFVRRFHKAYAEAEREERFQIFRRNYDFIRARNAEARSYELGVTVFADLTPQEFAERFGQRPLPDAAQVWGGLKRLGVHEFQNVSVPADVDWRRSGAVTGVKNQQQCGACWAFASTGALEGAWHIATRQLVPLSEQQLVDCSSKFGNTGCGGGATQPTFMYTEQVALCNEASYPYTAKAGQCHASGCRVGLPKYGVKGYMEVRPGDERALLEAVAQQPVTVAIEADQAAFQLYARGVLTQDCGSKIDHGVLLVGYGTDRGQDYWLIKNSWGPDWGEAGYARIARGTKGTYGQCGIKRSPVYPVVDGSKAQPPDITASLVAGGVCLAAILSLVCLCYARKALARWSQSRQRTPLLVQHTPAMCTATTPAPNAGVQRLGGGPAIPSRLLNPQPRPSAHQASAAQALREAT